MKHGTLKNSNAITGLSEFRHVMSAAQTAGSPVLAPITTTTRTTPRIFPAAFPRSASLACSGSQEVEAKPNSKSQVFTEKALSTTFLITYTLTGILPLSTTVAVL